MAAPPAAARDVSHALAPAYVWQLRVEHFGALQTAAEATGLGGFKREPGACPGLALFSLHLCARLMQQQTRARRPSISGVHRAGRLP